MANRLAREEREKQKLIYAEWLNKAAAATKAREKQRPTYHSGDTKCAERHRRGYFMLYDFLEAQRSRLIKSPMVHRELVRLGKFRSRFIRDLDDLKLRGKSPARHFEQLVNHLLVRFPMPRFWNNVWDEEGDEHWCTWFVDVAQGASVFKTCPLPITKKQAHVFMQAPSKYHPQEALRVAQFLDLGGHMSMVRGLLACEDIVSDTFKPQPRRETFYQELMRWFAQQPMLDPQKFEEITHWAIHRKFNAPQDERQPNLTMKGRTADTVLRDVEAWHDAMNRYRPLRRQNLDKVTWAGHRFDDWKFKENSSSKKPPRIWCVQQILCARELLAEGRALQHCVASYVDSCQNGQCSIWTLRGDGERALTVEIRGKTIRQARGKYNREASSKERLVLQRFASESGLVVGRWL
jgi:hypothetical protein